MTESEPVFQTPHSSEWHRQGKYTKADVIERIDALTHRLVAETEAADLPQWPDYGRVWLADVYRSGGNADG